MWKRPAFLAYQLSACGRRGAIEIAGHPPETMLGDTQSQLIRTITYRDGGPKCCPLVNREIPIIADSYVDMEFVQVREALLRRMTRGTLRSAAE
jgi:valyl-tRNA synthetase